MDRPIERKRETNYTDRTATRVWHEKPSENNPYLAEECRCHGYSIEELAAKQSFVDVLFLLLEGELPSLEKAELLNALMVALINPGPRHPAARAAMVAGVGRTFPPHILPIALTTLSGSHLGAAEVGESMLFLRKNIRTNPEKCAKELLVASPPPFEGDWHIAPGFGTRFGGIDPMPGKTARFLLTLPGSGKVLRWGNDFASALGSAGQGWLTTGVAAAAFCDLGFHPRVGPGLFQLASAPGLLAHGLEMANKPVTAMPFPDGDDYVIETDAR